MEETLGKNTVIQYSYIDRIHEIYYIPQDFKELIKEVKDKFNIKKNIKLYCLDFDNLVMPIRSDAHYKNTLKYCDRNSMYLLKVIVKDDNGNQSSDDDCEPVAEEEVHANKIPIDEIDTSNKSRRNAVRHSKTNNVEDNNLIEDFFTTNEDPKSDNDIDEKFFDALPYHRLRKSDCDVFIDPSFNILNRTDKDAKPKQGKIKNAFSRFANYIGLSDSYSDCVDLCVVDNSIPENGNEDIILAMPGCIIKKTWRISNKLGRSWPSNVELIPIKHRYICEIPKIEKPLDSAEIADISIRIIQ